MRCEVDDALKLNDYSLRNFISNQTYLSSYVDAEISSIIVCDQADIHDQHKVKENRALTPLSQSSPLPLSAARLDLLLTDNFAVGIQTMAEEVKNLSESERKVFLISYYNRGRRMTSGLQCAFNYQCFDALEAYSALLVLAPPEQRTDLLTGKSENGWSSLAQAISSGNSDMVSVCFYLLQWLPLDEVDKLVFPLAESLPLDDMCTLWEQYADFMQQQSNSLVKTLKYMHNNQQPLHQRLLKWLPMHLPWSVIR